MHTFQRTFQHLDDANPDSGGSDTVRFVRNLAKSKHGHGQNVHGQNGHGQNGHEQDRQNGQNGQSGQNGQNG